MNLSKLIPNKWFVVLTYDIIVIAAAWIFAFWFQLNSIMFLALPFVIALQLLGCWYYGLYRGIWRFASMHDLINIFKSVLLGSLSLFFILLLTSKLHSISYASLPLYALLLVAGFGGSRFFYRWLHESKNDLVKNSQRVLIVGAGQAGEGLVRDLLRYHRKEFVPVCFVDDNPRRKGQEIHGVRVRGTAREIPELVKYFNIDLIFIAIPSASIQSMRRIIRHCGKSMIPFRTLPSLADLTSGRVTIDALREVSIDDLIGREQVNLSWDKISENIFNKRILVTGGGGSIGSELCRQIAKLNPAELIIVDNCEFNLYQIEQELSRTYAKLNYRLCLISVSDRVAIAELLSTTNPEIIFHAAAFKHVPMLESQVRTAILNNLIGTYIVAEEAAKARVKEFVFISTDKAVNPTNIMGASKRCAEIFCQNLNARSSTRFITVRFGNVLGSTGSIVPLFKKQIASGGPLTVTHPDITRYFMTIPEATQLILQAAVMGEGGEIFVLDMGEPIKIQYLAEQMIRLAGKIPGKDINIVFTGLRPGEKLYEELFHESENLIQTEHGKILKAQCRTVAWADLIETLHEMQIACNKHEDEKLVLLLKQLVPEYHSPSVSSLSALTT